MRTNEIGVNRKLGAKGSWPSGRDSKATSALLDYDAAADYLCTTPRHVRELWAKRFLPAVKVGRYVRFTRTDLDAFIEARRVDALRSGA